MPLEPYSVLAGRPDPRLDELALALAAEFAPTHPGTALATLDRLGEEVAGEDAAAGGPDPGVRALREVLGRRHGFTGAREEYDHPDHSMLDVVLERRTGLPILLSVVYVEVARRAGIALAGVGLPGHYVAGHFGTDPPLLLDPFHGGRPLEVPAGAAAVRPWGAHETALRMLNNLVGSYGRRNDLGRSIRAAEMRLELPLPAPTAVALGGELRSLRARLN